MGQDDEEGVQEQERSAEYSDSDFNKESELYLKHKIEVEEAKKNKKKLL